MARARGLWGALLAGALWTGVAAAQDITTTEPPPEGPTDAPLPGPSSMPMPADSPTDDPLGGLEANDAGPRLPPPPTLGPSKGGAAAGARASGSWNMKWALEGYYRNRTVYLTNLANEDLPPVSFDPAGGRTIFFPKVQRTSYMMHRARLTPQISLFSPVDSVKSVARVFAQIDVFDDVIWGDNNGRSAAPLFAVNPTNTTYFGEEKPDVQIPRLWIEFQIPIGQVRVGRMPSHWGMGILANGGGSFDWDPSTRPGYPKRKNLDTYFDDDFGDNHFGSTNDRVMFVTKPIEVATRGKKKSNLIVGYAFDKISEAPLLTDEPFERRFRPFAQQGFISRGKSDDVNEHVLIALYNNPEWHEGTKDELRGGTYIVLRTQDQSCTNPSKVETNGSHKCDADDGSFVQNYDVWGKIRWGGLYAEGEGFTIRGDSFGGVPAPANSQQTAEIYGGVARVGWLTEQWDALVEVGHASGDHDLYAIDDGSKFTQRPLHPDHNVGLVLYEEILRERSARRLATGSIGASKPSNPDGAKGFASLGGVINSTYVNPRFRFRAPEGIFEGTSVVLGVLMAWNDEKEVLTGQSGHEFFPADGRGSFLGTEVDLGLHYKFYDGHVTFALETGYLHFGDALARDYDADGSFTLQTRTAFVF